MNDLWNKDKINYSMMIQYCSIFYHFRKVTRTFSMTWKQKMKFEKYAKQVLEQSHRY